MLVALATLVPGVADAEPSSADRATARTLAQEGHSALRNKDYAVAADRFERAVALVHAPSLLIDLARAQLGLGKLVDASENYNRIIREGVAPGAPASWVKALADAKAEITAIPPRLPWVTITVTGPSEPVVTIDGTPIGAASLGVKRPADPGRHKIRASGPGFLPATKSISLKEGESVEVTIELEEAPPEPEPEPMQESASAPLSAAEPPAWRKPATIGAFAVSGAGLVLGAVTGILAISKHESLSGACSNGVCGREQKADYEAFRTLTTLSNIGFITAGVAGAAGTVLLLTKPKQELPDATAGVKWSPFVGLGRAGVEGTF